MGGGGRHENLALGETPNIAARLEGLAPANGMIISPMTMRLIGQTFIAKSRGLQELKGVSDPMQVWQVLGIRDHDHLNEEQVSDDDASRLVGRDEEIGLLLRRWEQSKQGIGQVVLISGEGGIGKTSRVQIIRSRAVQERLTRVTF